MGRGAIEAGRAFLVLDIDRQKFDKNLAGVQRKMRNTGRAIAQIGAGIGAAGAAITGPLLVATQRFAKLGDQLNKISARTGLSVEALSELKFAAEQSGSSIETVEKASARLSRTLFDASRGSAAAVDALNALGLSQQQLSAMSPEQQLTAVIEALGGVEDASMRSAIAQTVLGRSGRELLPMIENMAALRAEASETGAVMTTEAAQAAADLTDAMNRTSTSIASAAVQIGSALAPMLIQVADLVTSAVLRVAEFIKENQRLVQVVAIVGATLTAVGTVLATIGAGIAAASIAVGGLSTAFGFLGTVMTIISAHPIIAAITALAAGFLLLKSAITESKDEMEGIDATVANAEAAATAAAAKAQQAAAQSQFAPQLAAAQNLAVGSPAVAGAATATDVDRSILAELRQQTESLLELVGASREGGGLAVGGG